MNIEHFFILHNFSGHSLQFKIFIIKTSVLLKTVLGKKWHFSSMGWQITSLCICCLCGYYIMHWSAIGLLGTFFLAPCFIFVWFHGKIGEYTGEWITTQNVCKRICICYILNEPFQLNISSRPISKSVRWEVTFLLSVYPRHVKPSICHFGPSFMNMS